MKRELEDGPLKRFFERVDELVKETAKDGCLVMYVEKMQSMCYNEARFSINVQLRDEDKVKPDAVVEVIK